MKQMTAPVTPVASVNDLTIQFGQLKAVNEVSFEVASGEVYALLGRNGAGKSSIVRCLLGQLKATSGTTRLCGEDVWKSRARLMERVAIVPETADIPPEANANQVAALYRKLYPSWQNRQLEDRLARFTINRTAAFSSLSKGQKKQLSLALALATQPEVLVLDDPTLGLDVVARRELYEELIGELADRGTTVLLTTHDLQGVEGIANRVGILEQGRLLLDEPLEALKHRFRRVRFQHGADRAAADEALSELGPVHLQDFGELCEALVESFDPAAVDRLSLKVADQQVATDPVSLEEIFIALCGEDKGEPS